MIRNYKTICAITLGLVFGLGAFWPANMAQAAPDKQYRSGQVITISNKNYLIANNNEFAEILEITADNKLAQASEVHGLSAIEGLFAGRSGNKYFLVVTTGRYLYRYDISNPRAPKIEFRRDLFVFKRGQFRIGSADSLAGNKDFIFGAGSNGVRSFFPDNLFVDQIYTFDKSYGLAAGDFELAVITENQGIVYDIASGAKLIEVNLENKDKMKRAPALDNAGNVYFPTDRGLVKINFFSGRKTTYVNPVPQTETFSYGAAIAASGDVYYANGRGITVLDKNFNKIKFLNTSKANFGANAWSVGLAPANFGAREIAAGLNKSSIILLDKNLKVLAQYKYRKLYPDFITTDLKIAPSVSLGAAGQKINLRLFGFWPNETAAITFGQAVYSLKVDNQGYASLDLIVPRQNSRQAIIQATGADSGFNYQTVFTIL
ncbi:MAG: hypothetical protein Q7R92_03340 [bacterium]|nr:hypothetical protein [bacterium]